MCNDFSGIALRPIGDEPVKVLFEPMLSSHEDIIGYFNVRDDNPPMRGFVRFEYVPKNNRFDDLDSYDLRIDERDPPEWCDYAFKAAIAAEMRSRVSRLIITDDRKIIIGAAILVGKANIGRLLSGPAWAYGSSTVKAYNSSTVTACDSSTVTACDSSTAWAYDSSTVTACDSSTVKAYNSSTVKACDSSTVTACDSSATLIDTRKPENGEAK
jgi:hypothetical protein